MTSASPGVLLIGASTPIGRAITARFVADGRAVVGASLVPADDPSLTADLVADCSTRDGAQELVATALDTVGTIGVVVVASARQPVQVVHRTNDDQWYGAYQSAPDVLFHVASAVLPHLHPGSAIVAVSSVNAQRPAPWLAAYASSKAAMEALVRSIAIDYGASGIRCNAVAPGVVPVRRPVNPTPEYPLPYTITAEDVAEAVHFLGSERAAAITGVVLPVDRGLRIASPSTAARSGLAERAATRWGPDPQD